MELLTIGQMAERNCVTKKTLRLYHEKGLLVPEHVDEENGRRYYTSGQSYQLDLIHFVARVVAQGDVQYKHNCFDKRRVRKCELLGK